MTLDSKVLSAAEQAGRAVIPNVPVQVVHRIVKAAFDAIGPLARSSMASAELMLLSDQTLITRLTDERDEARLARDELHAAQHREFLQVKALQTQMAALREALGELADFAPWGGTDFAAFTKWVQGVASDALTNTAEVAALYQLVPKGWGVKPEEATEEMLAAGGRVQIYSPIEGFLGKKIALAIYGRMFAAAPVAKGEAGEGTEPEATP